VIVISDVHGNFKTLVKLLESIPKEEKDRGIVLAGDLIDRGPMSAEVVQFCIDNKDKIQAVRGNHEELMIESGLLEASYFMKNGVVNTLGTLTGPYGRNTPSMWISNGGKEALHSYAEYDEKEKKTIFDIEVFYDHIEWMKSLPYYLEFPDVKNDKGQHLLVTHSSAAKVWKWSEQRRTEQYKHFIGHLTWGRPNTILPIDNIFNVFGHTPIANGPRLKDHYANIDTGCFYSNEPGYFKLTALQFPEMIVYQQENVDGKWI